MEPNKQIELRSEKVRNIIGQIPPLLLRNGVSIIFLSLLMLVGIATFIPYQPTINTVITVTQDPSGALHYTANIPEQEWAEQKQFTRVIVNSSSGQALPTQFQIVSVSDTMLLAQSQVSYTATLYPMDNPSLSVKLETPIAIPGKIELQKTTFLKWVGNKVKK